MAWLGEGKRPLCDFSFLPCAGLTQLDCSHMCSLFSCLQGVWRALAGLAPAQVLMEGPSPWPSQGSHPRTLALE